VRDEGGDLAQGGDGSVVGPHRVPDPLAGRNKEVPLRTSPLSPVRRRIAAGGAAAIAAALTPAAAADAATAPCAGDAELTQVFAPWGDTDWYFLSPDGSVEGGGIGWSFTGGAKVVRGTDPFGLGGKGDNRSLWLPRGASARSAPFCIRDDTRTVRWVQRAPRKGTLLVEVLHLDDSATTPGRTLDVVRGKGEWRPSPELTIPLLGTGAHGDDHAVVALKFTALTGAWSVDDLYVDPRQRY